MRKIIFGLLVLVSFIFQHENGMARTSVNDSAPLRVKNDLKNYSLKFEKNEGQTAREVAFFSRGNGYNLFLTPTESVMMLSKVSMERKQNGFAPDRSIEKEQIETSIIRMQMVGANPDSKIRGENKLASASHYFIGDDKSKWRKSIPHYQTIHYEAIYPGIDLVYYGNQGKLEYDFIIGPGADPKEIALKFRGSDKLSLDSKGNLVIETSTGKVLQRAPVAYQNIHGEKHSVDSQYILKPDNQVVFQVGEYDPNEKLVIDPVIKFSTYLGGSSSDEAYSIAVDSNENLYVTGNTRSIDFDTLNEIEGDSPDMDVFVFKLENTATGMDLVYSTYLGGDSFEQGQDIAVDAFGNAYVTGWTDSTDFNTVNPIEGDSGNRDVFVLKIAESAGVPSLVYSTYLGGSDLDQSESLALDSVGNVYVAGWTQSVDFDTLNPIEGDSGGNDVFVFKLVETPAGPTLGYSTYLGGGFNDEAYGIAVDSAGNAYVTGRTFSNDFDTLNSIDTVDIGSDTFVFKLAQVPGSLNLVYSTYLSGTGAEEAFGIAVDASGNAYVTGYTSSIDFLTVNPIEGDSGDDTWDTYVLKLQETAGVPSLVYSTYLGGSAEDFARDIALDSTGNVYVTGYTSSTDFDLLDEIEGDSTGTDAIVFKIQEAAGIPSLVYSTYLGGNNNDRAFGIAVDSKDEVYIAGWTASTDYPEVNSIEGPSGSSDVFVSKIGEPDTTPPVINLPPDIVQEANGPLNMIDVGTATATDDFSDPEDIQLFSDTTGQFVLGTVMITWTAIDEAGNTATAQQSVTVVDTTPPVIAITGANPFTFELGGTYVDPWATAVDSHDGPVMVNGATNPISQTTFSVVYTASDLSGNSATATRIVNMVDTVPPVITLLGPNPIVFNEVPFVEPGVVAIDAAEGNVQVVVTPPGPQTGNYVLTYTATDTSGNSATATRNVTIIDTTPPVISINGDNPLTHEVGTPFVDPWAESIDNVDGVLPVTATSAQITQSITQVTYSATDLAGNTSTAIRTVSFVDTTPPVLTLFGDTTVVFNETPFVEPGFSAVDAVEGNVAVVITPSGPQTGTFFLTYTATDTSGNSATAIRNVTVIDTTPPLVTVNGGTPLTLEMGIPYVDQWATAVDNVDGVLAATAVSNVISPSQTEVVYSATDLAGNTASATRILNFVDTTPPVLTLFGDTSVIFNETPYVEPGFSAVDSVEGAVPVVITPSGPPTGTYTLTYTATDTSGNSATAVRLVTVIDTTPPFLAITGANPLTHEIGFPYVDPWATAVDNVDGQIAVSGSSNPIAPNVTEVTYTATDLAGNTSTAVRTVFLVDTSPPVITLFGPNPATFVEVPFVEPGVVALDLAEGVTQVVVTPSVPQTGTFDLTYTATDSAGNSATATRTVTVIDTTPPVITILGANPFTIQSGQPYVDPWALAADNVDGAVQVTALSNPGAPGTFEVTYFATDLAGNTSTAVRIVNVIP